MGSDSEPAKALLPYLQRADELQKHEPLVAYYCRLYAMEKGLKIPQKERTKTTNSILVSLMNQLEKDKKSVKLGPDDYLYVEGFASNVFAKADKQDRAGRADLNTAKTFYAARIFFEVLSQFGELQPDLEQKQKYAVWKAADIRKALKEGRKPEPGPPGGEKEPSPSISPTSSYDMGSSESIFPTQPAAVAPPRHVEHDLSRTESFTNNFASKDSSPQPLDRVNSYSPSQPPPSHSSYQTTDNPAADYHPIPPSSGTPDSSYSQHYHPQSFPSDQHPMPPQNYHHQENPSPSPPPPPYSYPNFQSYPSFHDTTFPDASTHQPPYYHGSDPSYQSSGPSISNYPTYSSSNADVNNHVVTPQAPPLAPPPPPAAAAAAYTYDSNYQPSVEKITEAHKAARFAVGALAFDDVPVAVDFLRKSLELLTNPNAETH